MTANSFDIVERDGDQALWIRIGPVFTNNVQEPDPGVWISYQEHYMASLLQGPLLLTRGLWNQLKDAVEARFEEGVVDHDGNGPGTGAE